MPMEFNPETISLVIGLGNPGKEYTNTFHNAGQIVLHTFCGDSKFSNPRPSFSYTKYKNISFIVPQVFMNESGVAVANAISYFKSSPEQILVLHDDTDLMLGETRLQFGRGDAGHNGIKSIVQHVGTEAFWRFRIGVREHTEHSIRIKAKSIVLQEMGEENKEIITKTAEILKELLKQKNL